MKNSPTKGPALGIAFFTLSYWSNTDGKFGANHFTETTVEALTLIGSIGRMITLLIKLLRFLKRLLGAKCYAETTAFAPILDDMDFAMLRSDSILI